MDGSTYDWLDYYPFGEQAGGGTPTKVKFTSHQPESVEYASETFCAAWRVKGGSGGHGMVCPDVSVGER